MIFDLVVVSDLFVRKRRGEVLIGVFILLLIVFVSVVCILIVYKVINLLFFFFVISFFGYGFVGFLLVLSGVFVFWVVVESVVLVMFLFGGVVVVYVFNL